MSSNAILGVWDINESIEEMLAMYPSLKLFYASIDSIRSSARKLEKLCVNALLQEMTGNSDVVVGYNVDGSPILTGWHIGISHTKGRAVVILSKQRRVSVDIEYFNVRVSRITSRFIRPDEQGHTLFHQLVNWCTKEATYKYFHHMKLGYSEMRLHAFTQSVQGRVEVEVLRTGYMIEACYVIDKDYLIVYI